MLFEKEISIPRRKGIAQTTEACFGGVVGRAATSYKIISNGGLQARTRVKVGSPNPYMHLRSTEKPQPWNFLNQRGDQALQGCVVVWCTTYPFEAA